MYKSEFEKAIIRSQKLGLSIPEIKNTNQRYLNEKVQSELHHYIRDKLGVLHETEIIAQCLALNVRLKSVFSEYFNCPVYYTIGYVDITGDSLFKQTEESLKSMLINGIDGSPIKLHAWLTLPSMEILDFSIATTYGKVKGNQELMGMAIALHYTELTKGVVFHPMLIGEDFIHKIGGVKLIVSNGI